MILTGEQKRDGLTSEVTLIQIYTSSHVAWVSSLRVRRTLAEDLEEHLLSFPHEKRLCTRGSLLWGVTGCGLGSISSLYHPAGHHCHAADLDYLNFTKSSDLPILSRERLELGRHWSEKPVSLYLPGLFCLPTQAVIIKNCNSQCNLDLRSFSECRIAGEYLEKNWVTEKKPIKPLSPTERKQYDRVGLCFDKKASHFCLKRECVPDPTKGLHAWHEI